MAAIAQAPVLFSGFTTATGTSAQIIQVSASGVSAGLPAGNFNLTTPPSNNLAGLVFTVRASGWVKAHGATQTIAPGLQIFPFNTSVSGGPTASGTATFTPVASGTLVAGTVYNFSITQSFLGDPTSQTLSCQAPVVYVAGSAVTIASVAAPVVVSFATASQTEPITGINSSYDYPLANFAVSIANSVSDAVETLQLTQFQVIQN